MLFIWLRNALYFLARLVIPPPRAVDVAIRGDQKCPACGNEGCTIRYVIVTSKKDKPSAALRVGRVEVECRTCKAKRYLKPLYELNPEAGVRPVGTDEVSSDFEIQGLAGK